MFPCLKCDRTFARKCHLARHLQFCKVSEKITKVDEEKKVENQTQENLKNDNFTIEIKKLRNNIKRLLSKLEKQTSTIKALEDEIVELKDKVNNPFGKENIITLKRKINNKFKYNGYNTETLKKSIEDNLLYDYSAVHVGSEILKIVSDEIKINEYIKKIEYYVNEKKFNNLMSTDEIKSIRIKKELNDYLLVYSMYSDKLKFKYTGKSSFTVLQSLMLNYYNKKANKSLNILFNKDSDTKIKLLYIIPKTIYSKEIVSDLIFTEKKAIMRENKLVYQEINTNNIKLFSLEEKFKIMIDYYERISNGKEIDATIYRIRNKYTSKLYVGSTKDFEARKKQHCTKNSKIMKLMTNLNENVEPEDLSFDILEKIKYKNKNSLKLYEDYYIVKNNSMHNGYNSFFNYDKTPLIETLNGKILNLFIQEILQKEIITTDTEKEIIEELKEKTNAKTENYKKMKTTQKLSYYTWKKMNQKY